MMKKNAIRIGILVVIFVVGGVGGVVMDQYIFPFLATKPQFAHIGFIKKITERTTIINTTQEVVVSQDNLVQRVVTNVRPAIVRVVSTSGTTQQKSGAGVLLTSDGLIGIHKSWLIVGDTVRYRVVMASGQLYDATLEGIDTMTEIAFLKITNATNLPIVTFMRVDDMFVGQHVVAIAPTIDQNVRASSTNIAQILYTENIATTNALSDKWEGMLDIFPADSVMEKGAIVVNDRSELVGFMGKLLGQKVAVLPVSAIQRSMERFIAGKITALPHMNIEYVTITSDDVLLYDTVAHAGAKVLRVNSPKMGRAGLHVNDVIIAIDDQEISLEKPLPLIISHFHRGDVVHVKVLRAGQEKVVLMTL